ncbi:hypothetical protein DL98DRAFT_266351 [Cadophora sp. DSE1049]|nr:hypothetical protein DL98DRAFT_266351 [Cadophora sp. DSE1049]
MIDFSSANRSRTNLFFALSSNNPRAKQEVTNFIRWNLYMTNFLRLLGRKLSDTVAAWDSFRENGIYYFDDDSVSPVETAFGKLKAHLQKLRDLEKELRDDNPDGLNVHLGLESIEATNSQQKTARQLEILTVITIIFFPLALAANLFSTTGVLPFTPNLATFIFVFLTLGILVVATLVVLSNWRSWLQQMVECNQKAITYYKERFDGEDASIVPPKFLKRAIFSRRIRKAAPREDLDLENGIKKD